MARHSQPAELAVIKGADKRNPQRYRGEVPKTERGLGDPPDYFNAAQVACWDEIVANSLPGVVTGGDKFVLEQAAKLLEQSRREGDDFQSARLGHLISAFARLGLSPADRQKLRNSGGGKDNPFDEF